MAIVGIIANPAAGKDIRRLVAQGRFVPNQEKVNILKRIFAGLQATKIERVIMMPDTAHLGRAAADGLDIGFDIEFLDLIMFNEERDSTRSAAAMLEMGVDCLITLGGDGTNRAVALGSGNIPLVPISTGTNNVFPSMIEGTLAGLAAGVVAEKLVDISKAVTASKRLEVYVNGELKDIALVDLAVSSERFVGSRAIWDMSTVQELFLTRAEPASIGLSSIGAQLKPISINEPLGLRLRPGEGDTTVLAPVAPGMIMSVQIAEWSVFEFGDHVPLNLRPCTIALDGERSFSLYAGDEAYVTLNSNGPPVVSIDDTLREAALNNVFTERNGLDGIQL